LSGAASLLLYAAFPPLDLSLLAWLAPAFWVYLIRCKELPGRRPYRVIWVIAVVHWFFLLEGVGRAFWANYFGLVLLGSYLALYQVLFVALSRVAVHRWKMSVVVAAPVVWTGLELARGHVFTGFSIGLLGHTQVQQTTLIQIADLFGAYGVSFLVMFVAACLARIVPIGGQRWSYWPAAATMAALVSAYVYGTVKMPQENSQRSITVALIQGTEDTVFHTDVEAARQRASAAFNEYWGLTLEACEEHEDIQLIVWPESVFTGNTPQLVTEGEVFPPPGFDVSTDEFRQRVKDVIAAFDEKLQLTSSIFNQTIAEGGTDQGNAYLLAGTDSRHLSGSTERIYNTALLIDPGGNIDGRYDKMHRVMVGEYVPLGDRFPWLYKLLPLGRGVTPGNSPQAFNVHGVRLAPSICFESSVPHLIRRQVRELTAQGERPDILVNLTNDGWFWGTSILDLQLACAVFRSVELRRPFVIAANTGLTVAIDSRGAITHSLPRREPKFLVTEVHASRGKSWYERWGDLPAMLCLAISVALAISAGFQVRRRPKAVE
jgi:apolipoprotein N-acyltransferase